MRRHISHGDGRFDLKDFARLGRGVIFESGILVFHPENIEIGDDVYIGHNTILKGYYRNRMIIGDRTWIGQSCFFHSAGGIRIGKDVGIGPCVRIITSFHKDPGREKPILEGELQFEEVIIEDFCDIGVGATILPGSMVGKGAIIGAGAVVKGEIPSFAVAVGVPARVIRFRD